MPKTGNKTGGKGAEFNNDLATKTGIFKKRYKRNSDEGILIQRVQDWIANDKGGYDTLSTQEQLIIQRAAFTTLRLLLLEKEMIAMIRQNVPIPEWKDKTYLAWKSSLRSDLQLIGLERRAKDVTPTIEREMVTRDLAC